MTSEDKIALVNMRLMVLALWTQLRARHRRVPMTSLLRSFYRHGAAGQYDLVSELFDIVEQAACLKKLRHRIQSQQWAPAKAVRYFYRRKASHAHADHKGSVSGSAATTSSSKHSKFEALEAKMAALEREHQRTTSAAASPNPSATPSKAKPCKCQCGASFPSRAARTRHKPSCPKKTEG